VKQTEREAQLFGTGISPGEAVFLLERGQMPLLDLCITLEAIADRLPAAIADAQTLVALEKTETALRRHIALQEQRIFPYLRARQRGSNDIEGALRQLEYEHAHDNALIIEIIETAVTADLLPARPQIERFACLLRQFFEGYRRHCVWEREILGPICRKSPACGQHSD
jgi:hypothetical protein